MKNNTTIYHFIIDQSGSMEGMENETIQGFNDQLETLQNIQQKHPEQKILCSLTFFNEQIEERLSFGEVKEISLLSRENYNPNGLTALLDAVGKSIFGIQNKFSKELETESISIVMIIITDGQENASRFYTFSEIGQKIKALKETGLWNFTLVGADFDIIETSSRLNLDPENSMNIHKSEIGFFMRSLTNAISDYAKIKTEGTIKKRFF